MAGGLIALLDDVALLAKAAAASLDDTVAQASKAGSKAVGVVIDDTAVTPQYVVGAAANRELPIVARIAVGSLKNKLVFLLPGALVLSTFLPFVIQPLLMMGGAYLCYEGVEKLVHAWHGWRARSTATHAAPPNPFIEDEATKIRGAIRTDLILSGEIMAISLSAVQDASFFQKATALVFVSIFITLGVYGVVAILVKMDDVGFALAQSPRSGRVGRALGRGLVRAMPGVLATLSAVGTMAMIWVGGGIIVHGLAHFGLETFHGVGPVLATGFGVVVGGVVFAGHLAVSVIKK